MVTEAEMKAKTLLKDYSLEEILEAAEVTPEEALEYLITYGIIDPEALELIEATDAEGDTLAEANYGPPED